MTLFKGFVYSTTLSVSYLTSIFVIVYYVSIIIITFYRDFLSDV